MPTSKGYRNGIFKIYIFIPYVEIAEMMDEMMNGINGKQM